MMQVSKTFVSMCRDKSRQQTAMQIQGQQLKVTDDDKTLPIILKETVTHR